jgi:cytochrome c oxidase assembly protein subunit 15
MTSLTSQLERAPQWPLRGPCRLATAVTVWAVLVVAFGAMTTSTGSGMAFTDWPLSDGQLMPDRSLTTVPGFLEHFHRLYAGALGLMSLGLWLWLLRAPTASRNMRRCAFGGGLLILAQGVVGGVGVLLGSRENGTPLFTSVLHGALAQLTIATFAVLAYWLSPRCAATVPTPHGSAAGVQRTVIAALVLVMVQTVVGGIARHSSSLPALWVHVFNALAVFILMVITAGLSTGRLGDVAGVRKVSRVLMVLVVTQVILGVIALIVRTGVKDPKNVEQLFTCTLISMHVLVGALLTVTTAVLAAHVYRGAVPVTR